MFFFVIFFFEYDAIPNVLFDAFVPLAWQMLVGNLSAVFSALCKKKMFSAVLYAEKISVLIVG